MAGETTDKRKRRLEGEEHPLVAEVEQSAAEEYERRDRLTHAACDAAAAAANSQAAHLRETVVSLRQQLDMWKRIALSLGATDNGTGTVTVPDHRIHEMSSLKVAVYGVDEPMSDERAEQLRSAAEAFAEMPLSSDDLDRYLIPPRVVAWTTPRRKRWWWPW